MGFEFAPDNMLNITHNADGILEGTLKGDLGITNLVSGFYRNLNKHDGQREGTLALYADSLGQLLEYVQRRFPTPQQKGSSANVGGDGFHTFRTYNETLDVYTNRPWEVRHFNTKDDIIKVPDSVGQDVYMDVTGDYVDVGAFLEGVPEVFGVMTNGNPNNLFATVVINQMATCFFNESVMRRRGERLLRLIDWLEGQQIRTSIRTFCSSQCLHYEAMVKRPEETIDLDTLAVITHPDFFRRIIFRLMEYSRTWQSGYGTSTLVNNGYLKLPKMEENGIRIFSENWAKESDINRQFDQAERGIEQMLEDGEKHFQIEI